MRGLEGARKGVDPDNRRLPRVILVAVGLAVVGLGALLILRPIGATDAVAAQTKAEPSLEGSQSGITGRALADSLGLELRDGFHGDCGYYVEVEESGAGYCLDSVGETKADRYKIGEELRGRMPTDAEMAYYTATDRVANMSVDDPDYPAALAAAEAARQALIDATSPSTAASG